MTLLSFIRLHKVSVPSQRSDTVTTQAHPDYSYVNGVRKTVYPGCRSISKCVSSSRTGTGNNTTLTTLAAAYVKMHYISMTVDGDEITVTYPTEVA